MSYDSPPPPPPGYGYGAPAPGAVPGTNRKAIWSLVTGIVGLLCCGLLGIAAIILSQGAKKEIAASGQEGGGLATAGMVLGIVSLAWMAISLVLISSGNYFYDI